MEVEEILHQVEKKEKRARKLSLIFTFIPILTAAVLIYFTYSKVINAQKDLEQIEGELEVVEIELETAKETNELLSASIDSVKKELKVKTDSLDVIKGQMDLIEDFRDHIVRFNWSDQKMFFSMTRNRDIQNMFIEILKMKEKDVFWRIGGSNPEEGFDSPSFATYVMVLERILPQGGMSSRYNLKNRLRPISKERLRPGDILIYQTGYTMFYMPYRGQKVVLGMTPAGIRAVELDFAQITGYYEIPVRGPR